VGKERKGRKEMMKGKWIREKVKGTWNKERKGKERKEGNGEEGK
jgi:hypothetical protein